MQKRSGLRIRTRIEIRCLIDMGASEKQLLQLITGKMRDSAYDRGANGLLVAELLVLGYPMAATFLAQGLFPEPVKPIPLSRPAA